MRVTRSIWSFLTSEIAFAITMAVGFVATPLLLRWLGDERYGAVEATSDWIGYIGLLELGIAGSLMPLLAKALAQNNESRVRTLLAAGVRSYLGVVMLAAIAAVVLVAAIDRLLPVASQLKLDLRVGCAIGTLTMVVLLPLLPFRTLLEAEQRGYVVNTAILVQSMSITALSLVLAWAKWGIRGQFIAILVGGVGFNAIVVAYTRDRLPGLREAIRAGIRKSAEWKEVWSLNWPTFGFTLFGRVGVLTDNIIIGGLLAPAMVVPFLMTQQLAILAQRQLQGIGNASWAGLVELQIQGKNELFNQRLIELTRLIAILAVAVLIPICIYDRQFIRLWVGEQRFGGDFVVILAAINAFLLAIFSLWTWCINGIGEVRRVLPGIAVQTVINFALSIVLTLKLGLVGPLLGTTFGFISVSIWYLPMLLRRRFETRAIDLYAAAGWPVASALPFAAIVWSLSRTLPVHGWFDMAAEMSVVAVGYLVVWWLVGLSAGEKSLWLQRMSLLIPRSSC